MPVYSVDIDNLAEAQIGRLLAKTDDLGPLPSAVKMGVMALLRKTPLIKSVSYFRSTQLKSDEYEAIWSNKTIEDDFSEALEYQNHPTKIIGDGRVKQATRWWLNASILVVLASKIRALKPRNVIEAGSGNGVNLIALAAIFPDIDFIGLELTEAGVSAARAAAQNETAVRNLVTFVFGDDIASKISFPLDNLNFRQHDLTLPIDDARCDMVFTSLALEQMDMVFHKAFPTILSLADKQCLFFEPFLEFNSEPTKNILKTKSYLYKSFRYEIRRFDLTGQMYSMPRHINKLKFKFGVCEIVQP